MVEEKQQQCSKPKFILLLLAESASSLILPSFYPQICHSVPYFLVCTRHFRETSKKAHLHSRSGNYDSCSWQEYVVLGSKKGGSTRCAWINRIQVASFLNIGFNTEHKFFMIWITVENNLSGETFLSMLQILNKVKCQENVPHLTMWVQSENHL